MFGLRKKPAAQDTQIPYQVYETVQEPVTRRKRWIIRLLIALLVATLLVVGIVLYRNRSNTTDQSDQPQSGQDVQQSPQTNPSLESPPGEPTKTPLSDAAVSGTTNQPQ